MSDKTPRALVAATHAGTLATLAGQTVTAADRVRAWLAARPATTRRAYSRDLVAFAAHVGFPAPAIRPGMTEAERADVRTAEAQAVAAMLTRLCHLDQLGHTNERGEPMSPRAVAVLLLEGWRDAQLEAGLSAAVINRRLSAVRTVCRVLARADMGPGAVDVEAVPVENHDSAKMKGPSIANLARVIDTLAASGRAHDLRDLAIVLLAAQRGLRRAEIAGLRLADVDLDNCAVMVRRKGRRDLQKVSIGGACCEALEAWLAARGPGEPTDSAFVVIGTNGKGLGMSTTAIADAVKRAGQTIGCAGWTPHRLRHSAITAALKQCGDNIAKAQEFAGHANSQTTRRYIDDRARLEQAAVDAMADVFTINWGARA